jgi:PAS domain S-box-containing protein
MSEKPHSTSNKSFAETPLFRNFSRYAGLAVFGFGGLIIISWYAHWTGFLQFQDNAAPTQYSTALCFILSGAALFLLTTRRQPLAPWIAGAVVLFTLMTLLEYATNENFGIDLLLYKPYFTVATAYPGRMPPLTASCFVFIGLGILLAGLRKGRPRRLAGSGLLACIVIIVAAVGLSGYAFGLKPAYGWGADSNMTINSAILFLLLGSGLLVWSWNRAVQENFNFLRWLPVTGSVTLMIMIAFISATNMSALRSATDWRKHNFQVILAGQAFEENLIDMQRGLRGYVTLRDTNALAVYQNSSAMVPQKFNQLVELTRDNSAQQGRLKNLATAMRAVSTYDTRLLAAYNLGGVPAVIKDDATGTSRAVFGRARDILKDFSQAQQIILDQRDSAEASDYHKVEYLLVFGSGLAALLLIIANRMASRELRERRRAEATLREVLTLQKAVLSSASYAIIATDSRGIVQSYNPAAEKMLGYTADEVIGKATPLLWRDAEEIQALMEKTGRENGKPPLSGIEALMHKIIIEKTGEYEATFIHKNRKRFPALISATALTDAGGNITGVLGVIADISEQRQRQAALRESEQRFRLAFDDGPIGMTLVNPQGRFLRANRALSDMLGYSEAELREIDFQSITHPEDLEKDLSFVRQVLAGEILSYQMEKRYFDKNRQIVFVRLSVSLIRDPDGEPFYFVVQIENITGMKSRETEREKLIAELRESLARVKTLSGLIPICGWCKNVRADKGYWQTVEQYVLSQTEATFSHGICPDCQKKFKDDIARANGGADTA